jgi:hypothetical protein
LRVDGRSARLNTIEEALESNSKVDQGSLLGFQPIENNGLEFARQVRCFRGR